jgi:hypothetical protein
MSEAVEAAKYYKEMREEVYESIMDTFQCNDNSLLDFSSIITRDLHSFGSILHWKVKINGNDLTGKVELDSCDFTYEDLAPIGESIVRSIAKEIKMSIIKIIFDRR